MNYSVNFIIGKYYIDTVDMTIRKSVILSSCRILLLWPKGLGQIQICRGEEQIQGRPAHLPAAPFYGPPHDPAFVVEGEEGEHPGEERPRGGATLPHSLHIPNPTTLQQQNQPHSWWCTFQTQQHFSCKTRPTAGAFSTHNNLGRLYTQHPGLLHTHLKGVGNCPHAAWDSLCTWR